MSPKIHKVIKRSGAVVPFKRERIANAIYRAAVAVGGRDRAIAEGLADQVVAMLEDTTPPDHVPHVEEIQDIVEETTESAKTTGAVIGVAVVVLIFLAFFLGRRRGKKTKGARVVVYRL